MAKSHDMSDLDFTGSADQMIGILMPEYEEDQLSEERRKSVLSVDSAEKIYAYLVHELQHLGFCDHLKRYIYRTARMTGRFETIPTGVFQEILIGSFTDHAADYSFYPTKAHRKEVTRAWLERKIVSRDVAMLLGFGLGMGLTEVNDLLHKGLHEPLLDPKEPLEAVCHYCFRNGYSFQRFKRIWEQFDPGHPSLVVSGENLDSTMQCQKALNAVTCDEELLSYLYHLPLYAGSRRQSSTARKQFIRLYDGVREELAKRKTETEAEETALQAQRKAEQLARSDQRNWEENRKIVECILNDVRVFTRDEISGADIENELYSSVPKTPQGNLPPMKASAFNELFDGKRLNRQHIGKILSGEDPITRYDLITMSFFYQDLLLGSQANEINAHFDSFIQTTNAILRECNMADMYAANPYEFFILLCMRTESPIESYSEIWGMSFDEY